MRKLEKDMYSKKEVEDLIQEAIFNTRMEELNKQIIKLEIESKQAEEEIKSFYLEPEKFKAELRSGQ